MNTDRRYVVGAIDPDERVSCYYCGSGSDYGRGEAVLAGPDHPPYDGNANYVCLRYHLLFRPESLIDVVDQPPGTRFSVVMTIEQYRALAGGNDEREVGKT